MDDEQEPVGDQVWRDNPERWTPSVEEALARIGGWAVPVGGGSAEVSEAPTRDAWWREPSDGGRRWQPALNVDDAATMTDPRFWSALEGSSGQEPGGTGGGRDVQRTGSADGWDEEQAYRDSLGPDYAAISGRDAGAFYKDLGVHEGLIGKGEDGRLSYEPVWTDADEQAYRDSLGPDYAAVSGRDAAEAYRQSGIPEGFVEHDEQGGLRLRPWLPARLEPSNQGDVRAAAGQALASLREGVPGFAGLTDALGTAVSWPGEHVVAPFFGAALATPALYALKVEHELLGDESFPGQLKRIEDLLQSGYEGSSDITKPEQGLQAWEQMGKRWQALPTALTDDAFGQQALGVLLELLSTKGRLGKVYDLDPVQALQGRVLERARRNPRNALHLAESAEDAGEAAGQVGSSAYEIAKTGGRHAGAIRNYSSLPNEILARALRSFEKRAAEHEEYLRDPAKYDKGPKPWDQKNSKEREHLLDAWRKQVEKHQTLAEVLRGMLRERPQ